jgi:hypothetical protein
MVVIEVTEDVSQPSTSRLNSVALSNMPDIEETLDVSQFPRIWLKRKVPENINLILVTDDVTQLSMN